MAADHFGIKDAVRSTVAPAGFETVHQAGFTWAWQGSGWADTTRISPAEWNALIAQFRGLLTLSGVDLSDLPAGSPLILREALTRAIVAHAPAAIAANAEAIADALAGEATFITAMLAAAPFDASALTTGTLVDARLPARVGTTGDTIADANSIVATGFFRLASTAANIPMAQVGSILQLQYAAGSCVQVWLRTAASDIYARVQWGGTWGAWTRVHTAASADATYPKSLDTAKNLRFATNLMEAGYTTDGTLGAARLRAGSASASGYLEFYAPNGTTRYGYVGLADTTKLRLILENGCPGLDIQGGWVRVQGYDVLTTGARPDGTLALAQAGTDATLRTWTAAHLKGAVEALSPSKFRTEYVSAETTITLSSTLTFAHGLGVTPKMSQAILRCKTADLNYAVGDEVDLRDAFSGATNAAYAAGAARDATNIKINMRYPPALVDKAAPAGSPANIDTAKWKLVVRAWA